MRRGSVSTTISAILSLATLLLVLGSALTIYRNEVANYVALVHRGSKVLEDAAAQVKAVVSSEGLTLLTDKPPTRVVGVVALYPDGSARKVLDGTLLVRNGSVKLLDGDTVKKLADKHCKLLIVLGNGNYIVKDLNLSLNLSEGVQRPTPAGAEAGTPNLSSLIKLDPYVTAGEALKPAAFLNDPIPGDPGDADANFIPEVTVRLRSRSLGSVTDFLNVRYSSGNHSYVLYLSNPKLNFRKYYAMQVLVPLMISRSSTLQSITMHLLIKPINNIPLSGLDIFHLRVLYRPVWFAVLPIDYWRTPLVTIPHDVMFLGQNQYSVAKALTYFEGPLTNTTLTAYQFGPGGPVFSGTLNKYVTINVNPAAVFNSLPANLSSVVVLAGVELAVGYYWSQNQWVLTNPFAEVSLGIFNTTPLHINVGAELIGKPVIVPLPPQGFALKVLGPGGTQVSLVKALNVGVNATASDASGYAYFIPKEAGTYELEFRAGGATSISGESNITLIPYSTPAPSSASGPIANARAETVVEGEAINLSSAEGAVGFNATLKYSFTSTLSSPVTVTFENVSNESGYYRYAVSTNGPCRPTTSGWCPAARRLNTFAYASVRMYKVVVECVEAVAITFSYGQGGKLTFHAALTIPSNLGELGREAFTIVVSNHGLLRLSAVRSGDLLTYCSAGGAPLLALVDPAVINNLFEIR